MLRCTTAPDRPDSAAGPVDHIALYHEARAMRSAYIAGLFARWTKALRGTFVQTDRRARFIRP
jgi:hypothetical protein